MSTATRCPCRIARLIACCCLVACLHGTAANALVVFRIGGEDLPPPDLPEEAELEFRQLSWRDVDENRFGLAALVDLEESHLSPVHLDPDINLVPLLEEMGGWAKINGGGLWKEEPQFDNLRDGDPDTAYFGDVGLSGSGGSITGVCCGSYPAMEKKDQHIFKVFGFNLGGAYNIDRIFFRTRPGRFEAERHIKEFRIATNDGDPRKHQERTYRFPLRVGYFSLEEAYHITENNSGVVDLEMPHSPVQYIVMFVELGHWLNPTAKAKWEIAEFEIYGSGFAPAAGYVSNVIDLGGASSLGELTWSGSVKQDASLSLSARSGNDEDPNTYFRNTFRGDERSRYDESGRELTRSSYRELEGGTAGGVSHDKENWEFWSPPLDFSAGLSDVWGSQPRQFVQFKVDFKSAGEAGGRLDFLQFAVTQPPVASAIVAEITPVTARIGEPTRFTYLLRPDLLRGDLGFDTIEIQTRIPPASVDAVRIGGVELGPDGFSVSPHDGKRFSVRIPRVGLQQTGELIEVDFGSEVFQVATVFAGRVYDSEKPHEVRQRVRPGDADPLVDSDRLTVSAKTRDAANIRALNLSPFSPNGDGINDLLTIDYDLVNLLGTVPTSVEIFDLGGNRVAEVRTDSGESGRFSVFWDGRDGAGELSPPGIYLLRLRVAADREREVAIAAFSLAY